MFTHPNNWVHRRWFRNSGGNWTTLPGKFKDEGYLTLGMGKIFHETMPANDPQDRRADLVIRRSLLL